MLHEPADFRAHAFAADSSRLVVHVGDEIRIVELVGRAQAITLLRSTDRHHLAFARGRNALITCSDTELSLWQIGAAQPSITRSLDEPLNTLRIALDGRVIGSGGSALHIWTSNLDRQLARIDRRGYINAFALMADGESIAVSSLDGTFRLEPARPERVMNALSQRLTRDMTATEWQRFIGDEPFRSTRDVVGDAARIAP